MNWTTLTIFIIIGAGVTIMGLIAARWMRADLRHLNEWGLAGRRFGTVITWFLLGGDLFTAYTFIAVPSLVFASGGLGLFAFAYASLGFPFAFLMMPRLWRVARNRGYVTAADFVKDRFNSRTLALLVAITGIVATLPYVALQIYGIAVVIAQMGINVEVSLVIAFLVVAVFTAISGLRAPAMIAFVKDTLLWFVVITIAIVVPIKLGGYGAIFAKVPPALLIPKPSLWLGYSTLVLGSTFALFLYPHAVTGTLASKSDRVIQRNAALLPAYSFMLGLIALMGFMALAVGVKPHLPYLTSSALPQLIQTEFPAWFTGIAFGAIAIGALVPASVMSIAAANLFNRNIWQEYIRPRAKMGVREETIVSQVVSFLVKLAALLFVAAGAAKQAINLQLAGGVWIMQTLPAVFLAMFVRWLDRWAILAGWIAGMGFGTYWVVEDNFKSSLHIYPFGPPAGTPLYGGLVAFAINLAVVLVWTGIARLVRGSSAASQSGIPEDDYEYAPERESALPTDTVQS
ncbi:MAG: sodium:solute symporter [Candidatus Dormibacteraeota bacterium]|nr:sodium:solute symporter [Candidatus Dormibacteraeota bacterium]